MTVIASLTLLPALLGFTGTRLARTLRLNTFLGGKVSVSIALVPDVSVKQIGLGLAAAVLVDATVVRLVLVPAVMELLGTASWWLPGWLARLLPAGAAERSGDRPAREPAEVH